MKTIVVLQPGYLPWLGFFDQMRRADVFVYYDDVQFDKNSWRNRNRIRALNGPHWLSVPVLHQGLGKPLIKDIRIDNRVPWARKHIGTLKQFYREAVYIDRYIEPIEKILNRQWIYLVDLNVELAAQMAEWLKIKTQVVFASKLGIEGERSERLLAICKHFQAQKYLSGDSAREYLDVGLFSKNGIKVEWQDYQHPAYRQLHGEFLPYLSALDLLLNMGDESAFILKGVDVKAIR